MALIELLDPTSKRFWRITLGGSSITTSSGTVGMPAQPIVQPFPDVVTASKEHDRLIAAKLSEGYHYANPPKGAPVPGRVRLTVRIDDGRQWRELVLSGGRLTQRRGVSGKTEIDDESSERHPSEAEARELLDLMLNRYGKSGFKEVSRQTQALDELESPQKIAQRGAENLELVQACLDHPDDDRRWGVYADWLQTQGDLRGELAALITAGKEAESEKFLGANDEALWGALSEFVGSGITDFSFRHGFLSGVSLKRPSGVSPVVLAELTASFFALPLSRFVTSLELGSAGFPGNDWAPTLAAVVASKNAAELRSLSFDQYNSSTSSGDLSAIWAGLPKLEHLQVRSGEAMLGKISHSTLKTFVRECAGLSRLELDAILEARWPQLERLELWIGSAEGGSDVLAESLAPLLAARGLPRLRHLGLVSTELFPSLIPALARSKLLPQLRVLDASQGPLMDSDVGALLVHRQAFTHLERLDLTGNRISERLAELKAALPNVVLGVQRPEPIEDDRYDEVGE